MASPIHDAEPPNPQTQTSRRRRKKSIVWEHFTAETISSGCTRACCKQCNKSFAYINGSKLAGTSHLKRHIALGICPVSRRNQEGNELKQCNTALRNGHCSSNLPKRNLFNAPGSLTIAFDQELCNHSIAKMVLQHGYPLHIVEHRGFIDFVRTLQPRFNFLSFNDLQAKCVAIYLKEKSTLLDLIHRSSGRVSLALDLWTSDQAMGCIVLSGHFMDDDWRLHRRVLTVLMVPSPHSEAAFNHAVVACLTDWNLESRMLSMTLDSSFSVVRNLRGLLSSKNSVLLNGQLVLGHCFARVLGRLAQEALGSLRVTVMKIRQSMEFIKASEAHVERFNELKRKLQVDASSCLLIDDQTKWDTTYHMLVAAYESREVFSCLNEVSPSTSEWMQVEALCVYLKLLFESANVLTSRAPPPASVFFVEAWKIQSGLAHGAVSRDPLVSSLAGLLWEKFDEYWRESCLVFAAAAVMDPRFKMKFVEFSFDKVYNKDAITRVHMVDESLHELYDEYVAETLPLSLTFSEEGGEVIAGMDGEMPEPDGGMIYEGSDQLSDFDVYISGMSEGQELRSELDRYLEEAVSPRSSEFDVLSWWKVNGVRYPTLSRMAGDLLSIPGSTVEPDCVFNTVGKRLDGYRSLLQPLTLEAVVCARNWLQFEDAIVKNEL